MIVAGADLADEVWKVIPGFDDYAVSNRGRVKRIRDGASNAARAGKILRPALAGGAKCYERVALFKGGPRPYYQSVHRLVLLAFIGPPPSDWHQSAHNDGNSRNNSPSNLRWALPKENSQDRILHGTQVRGADHPQSKITLDQVAAIRQLHENGNSAALISQAVGLGRSTTLRIISGETYG